MGLVGAMNRSGLRTSPMQRQQLCGCGSAAVLHWGILSGLFFPLFAAAQDVQPISVASKFSIVPRVSVTETFTNNALLDNANKRSDLITQLSPGIRISSTGGRIKGSIDYSLTELLYSNNSSRNQSINNLNASGTVEAVDGWAFLDFSGNVGQQAISAFGTPSSGGVLSRANSTESAVFQLSPYLRGRLGGIADYEARYSIVNSRTASAIVANSDQRDLLLKLASTRSAFGLSWGVDANNQTVDYGAGRSTRSSALNARLQYALNTQWAAYTKIGHESNDFSTVNAQTGDFVALGGSWTPNPDLKVNLDKDNRGFTGLGVNWAPSKRASLTITRDGRLYGATHNIALAYRTPSTAWTVSDSRSTTSNPSQNAGPQSASLYDLLTNQFAAGESDPIRREQYDAFLQANGIKPGQTAVGGFLSSSLSLQRSQQVSFALFGARSTVSLVATRSHNTKLDTLSTAVDDLLTANSVVQSGLSANYSYRLTAKSVASLAAARQSTSGSNGVAGTSSKSVTLNLSTQLTRDANASVGARRAVFDSITTPYSETAVTGNLSVQF